MVVHSPSKPTTTPWPALLPMGALAGKPPVPIARPATLVGSRQTANLRLHSSTVSKAHALILSSESKVHIRDLNSRTKVFVNGKEVRQADLREGDQVKIGRFTFRFTAGPKIQSNARRRSAPAAQLETDAGDAVSLDQRVIVIGQRAGCDLVLSNPAVSTTHAAVYDVNGRRYVMDLGSRTGTLVNNQKTLQVELKIGDVIDIGGTDVRYTATAGAAAEAPVARSSRPAAAPAVPVAKEEPDLDELLALESLNEAPAPPKPSGQSKLFEPPSTVPDDTNAPIAIEGDEMKLPEPQPEVEEKLDAEPAIVESKLFAPPASVPDDTNAPIPVDEAEPELDPEPRLDAEPKVEPTPAIEEARLFEPPASLSDDSDVPISVEQAEPEVEAAAEPPPQHQEQPAAIQEEPEMIPLEIEDHPAPSAKAAEDELMSLLDETLEAESQRETKVPQEPTAAIEEPQELQPVASEEPAPVEEELAPIAEEPAPISVEEEPLEVAAEPLAEVESEVAPEPEPQPIAEDEGEVVGTATANVDVIPQPDEEEIAQEVHDASTAFPENELPASETATPIPEEPPLNELDELLEDEPQAQAPPAPEPIAAAPIEPETPPPLPQAEEALQEPPKLLPGAPKPRWIPAPSTTQFTPTVINIQRPRPPVDFNLDELLAPKQTPFASRAPLIEEAPVPTPAPPPPPAPPVVEEKISEPLPTDQVEELPLSLQEPPAAEDQTAVSDELALDALEELAPAESEQQSSLVPVESAPPLPIEEAPAPVAQEPAEPEELALEALEPAPQAEDVPPLPSESQPPSVPAVDAVDDDDLALAALEELAPPTPQPQSTPPLDIEPTATPEALEEVVEEAESAPAPLIATTSPQIIPEAPPAISTTSSIAPADEDAADLLEELPEEEPIAAAPIVADKVTSPILSSTAAPAQVESPPQAEEPAAPDVFSLGQRRAAAPRTPHHRGVGSPARVPPRPRPQAPIPPRWGPLPSAVVADIVPPPSARRTRKKISVLLVLMLVAMVLAALAVWKFVLPRVLVEGTIRFENAGALRGEARDAFQKTQLDLLAEPKVRATAEGLFKSRPGRPAAAGFFVDQDFRDPQLKSRWQQSGDRAELQITYQGTDPTLDPDRLFCLLQAIYDANKSNVSTAAAAERTLDQKRMAASAARAELNKIRERRVALEAIVRPDAFELAATQSAVDKLDQDWTDTLKARKAIAADIERLQQPTEAAATGTSSDGDSALELMNKKLAALNARVADAKSAAARDAADARKSLNSTIEQFQASVGVAQGMMKDNPALAAYITSAQKLHEASWKLQGDLIERQERQQKQLLEYKKRLEEQVEVRKREMIEKDPDLKELNHLLESKRREFNNLSATGALKRDVEKLRSDITTTEGRILARTVALSEDSFYKDAIAGLKQIIDSVQGQLDMDRAASEKLMNELETRFRNTSPQIETLPTAQQNLAERLAEQATAMQAARKHYTEATQSQDADANDRLKDLQAEAAKYEAEITLRRRELSAEQQKKLTDQQSEELKKKQAALAEADKAEQAARDRYRQKMKELDLLVERDRAYQTTREELQRIVQVDEPLKLDVQTSAERSMLIAQRARDSAIAPQAPLPPKITEQQDYRYPFGIGAVLVVGLIFGSLIFFTAHSKEHPASA